MWELQGQLSCSFCPQFFCGAAQQLVVEGFPHCCARQINVAGPWEWRCGRHTLQKRKAPSKLCLFVTICPFPIRWVKCLHCEEEEREDAGGQNGYIFVWLVLASPCFMPPSQMGGDTSGGADAELASRCCGVQERNSWRGLGQAAVVFQAWEGAGQRPSWLCWRPWRAQLCFGQVRDWEKKRSLWIANTMRGSWWVWRWRMWAKDSGK